MSELNIYQNRSQPTEPLLSCSVEWVTQITENRSGKENRIPKLTEPQFSVQGSDFVLRDDEYDVFVDAFATAEGKNNAFPFKCPLDYYCFAVPEYFDVDSFQQGILVAIDSLNYQIVKRYYILGVASYKTITLPVNGTVKVYEDNVQVFPVVNLNTGVVTFTTPPTGDLTVSCEFRLPMRFDVDDNQLNQIKRAVDSIYAANDTSLYLAVNFRLLEDMNYVRRSPLVAEDWKVNIPYDFDGNPLSDVAYSERSLTRIQSSDNRREVRDGLGVLRKKYAIANNNMAWRYLQKYYNLFMVAKGRLIPFTFEDSLVRLDSDVLNASMLSYNVWDVDGLSMIQVLNNGSSEIKTWTHCMAVPPPPKIDFETYVIPIIDMTSLTAPEISNIQSAITQLRNLLADSVYGGITNANKYVKVPVEKSDERYVLWGSEDYRDNISEPKKFLYLMFVDESNQTIGSPQLPENSYHYIPRNSTIEPTDLWLDDFDAFIGVYPTLDKFYSLVFSPTGSPQTDAESAFNPHLIDVMAGNNGYPALSQYGWTGKPYWDENATGQDIYNAIIAFL